MICRSRSLGAAILKSGEADLKKLEDTMYVWKGGATEAGGGGSSFTKGVGQKVLNYDKTLLCSEGTTAIRSWSSLKGPDEDQVVRTEAVGCSSQEFNNLGHVLFLRSSSTRRNGRRRS